MSVEPPTPEPASAQPAGTPHARRQRRKRGPVARWARRIAGAIGIAVALAFVGTLLLLGRLETPFVKRRLQALLRDNVGVEVDWTTASVTPWGGARVTGLTVRAPAPDDAGPPLFAIAETRLEATLDALMRAPRRIHALVVRGVRVHVVERGPGESSIARFVRELGARTPDRPRGPGRPLSETVRGLLALPAGWIVDQVALEDIELVVERRARGERVAVRLPALVGTIDGERAPVAAAMGTPRPGEPMVLDVAPLDGAAAARGVARRRLVLGIDDRVVLGGGAIAARVDARVVEWEVGAGLPRVGHLLGVDVAVAPEASGTRLRLKRLVALDEDVRAFAEVEARDAASGVAGVEVPRAALVARLERAAQALGPLMRLVGDEATGMEAPGAEVALFARGLRIGAEALGAGDGAALVARVRAPRVRGRLGAIGVVADGVAVDGAGPFVLDKKSVGAPELSARARATALRVGPEGRPWIDTDGARVELSGRLAHAGRAASVRAEVTAARLEAGGATVRGASARVGLERLAIDLARPLASSATVSVEASADEVARGGAVAIAARGVRIEGGARWEGGAVSALSLTAPIASLAVRDARGRALAPIGAATLRLSSPRAHVDLGALGRSHGEGALAVELPGVTLKAQATQAPSGTRFSVDGSAAALAWVEPLLPVARRRLLPWATTRASIRSTGTWSGGAIAHQTTVRVQKRGRAILPRIDVDAVEVALTSSGDAVRHRAEGTLALEGLTLDGRAVALAGGPAATPPRIRFAATIDRRAPSLSARLDGEAGRALDGHLELSARRDGKVIDAKLTGKLPQLGILDGIPGLQAGGFRVEWGRAALDVDGSARVSGLVGAERRTAAPTASLLERARGEARIALTMRGVRAERPRAIVVGEAAEGEAAARDSVEARAVTVTLSASAPEASTARRADVTIELPAARALIAGDAASLSGLTARAHVEVAALGRGLPDGRADAELRVARVQSALLGPYPVSDLVATLRGRSEVRGHVTLESLQLDNPGGGTHLDLAGGVDLTRLGAAVPTVAAPSAPPSDDDDAEIPGRRAFALRGTLAQRLDALTAAPGKLRARGRLELPLAVESGDLSLFRVDGAVRLAGVAVALPAARLDLDGVDGELPFVEELRPFAAAGARRVGDVRIGPFARLRFADQLPFMSERHFLSIKKIRAGDVEIGPLAANARIDHNLVAVDQLEAELRGGKVTGQLVVDVRPGDPQLALTANVSGVRPSTRDDDPLDATVALVLAPLRYAVEGRAEILRIGRRHLLDVVDLLDPYRADRAMNRVRTALALGYPRRVRLAAADGFARLLVEIGGLLGAVRIDEVRGLPVGPLLKKYLAPLVALLRKEPS